MYDTMPRMHQTLFHRAPQPSACRAPFPQAFKTAPQALPAQLWHHRALAALLAAGALGWLLTVLPAHAQPAAAPRATASAPAEGASAPLSKGEIKAMREFKMLDANGDNRLSRSEVALFPRLANAFDDADTNHDGYVSYEEVRAFAAKYRAERDKAKAAAASASSPAGKPPASEKP